MITDEELARFPDTFNGDDAHLVRCIEALLSLDAKNALVPHGLGGHARGLLSAAMHRLASQSRAAGVQGADADTDALALADKLQSCLDIDSRDCIRAASMLRRLATPQPPKDAGAVPARYFADGPEGFFFSDDLKLARAILDVYDESQDWTITDTQHPQAEPADSLFVSAVRKLAFAARTSGGTAGRDDGLCAALDAVEAMLAEPESMRDWSLRMGEKEIAAGVDISAGIPDSADPEATDADNDPVQVERGLLGAACAAIAKKRDAPKVLEALRKITMTPRAEPAARAQVAVGEQSMLSEYVADYEYRGEDGEGRDACYTPNEREQLLIEDAILGWDEYRKDAAHPLPAHAGAGAEELAVINAARDVARRAGPDREHPLHAALAEFDRRLAGGDHA